METTSFNKLPLETLQLIAENLHDTYRPSLYAFGLVNKTCHKATLPFIFREVHLKIHGRKSLQSDVDSLIEVLSAAESIQHVRHLSLAGSLLLPTENEEKMSTAEKLRRNLYETHSNVEVLGDEGDNLGAYFYPDESIELSPEEDEAWTPIVNFVSMLPHLTKMVYDCRNQFPPSLLNALHKHHPRCKLYHLTLWLRSLRHETFAPHEMALITSPCLYSVKVTYAWWRDSNGVDDYHEDAMPELVAGFAPNLKEVHMVRLLPAETRMTQSRRSTPRSPWRGLPEFVPGRRVGLLTSWSYTGYIGPQPEFFQTWHQCMDFSALKHLALGGGSRYPGIDGEVMNWIAHNCSLPQLETLQIRLDRNDGKEIKSNYASDASSFFETLNPLQELTVYGPLDAKILDSILSRHGHTLQKLSLRPYESSSFTSHSFKPMVFGKEHLLQIQTHCPVLQDLSIPIKRTQSDAHEAELYRILGGFENIRVLFLTLDCSNWYEDEDEDDSEPNVEIPEVFLDDIIRGTFLNCAVDEVLARSIWETICRNKAGKRLESLKLFPVDGGDLVDQAAGYNDILEVVDNLSRSWLIQRSVRDDEDRISVKELDRLAREARDEQETAYYDYNYHGDRTGSYFHRSSAIHLFRRIWPCREGSIDWRLDWTSSPLYNDE